MISDNKPVVTVLSRNYSTGLGLIRSLGSAGYTVDLVASARRRNSSDIAAASKYVRNSVEFLTDSVYGSKGEEIAEHLLGSAGKEDGQKVLFPADDYTTYVMDMNRESLKDCFVMPGIKGGKSGDLCRLMEKDVQGELAREAGLKRPFETVVSLGEEKALPPDIVYPCFIKPLKSVDGEKQEMAVAANRQELEAVLGHLRKSYPDRSVLVQEYLNIDKEYDVGGVCLGERIIIPAVIEKTRIAEHEVGVTMTGRLLPLDTLGDKTLKPLLKMLDYYGMFDLEFNLCGGSAYFNEINFRSGGPHFSYYLNGVNLPDIFVRGVTGQEIGQEEEKLKSFGKTFVYEKVAWEDFIHGFMNKSELARTISDADYTLLANADDPEPGRIFEKKIRLSALKNKTLKFLKR